MYINFSSPSPDKFKVIIVINIEDTSVIFLGRIETKVLTKVLLFSFHVSYFSFTAQVTVQWQFEILPLEYVPT